METGDFSIETADRLEFLFESTSFMFDKETPGGGGGGVGVVVVVVVVLNLCPWISPRTSPTKTIFIITVYLLEITVD